MTRTVSFAPNGNVTLLDWEEAEMLGVPQDDTWLLVTRFNHDEFAGVLCVNQDPAEGAILAWHDHVVNTWTERFTDFRLALMRLALLIDAVDHDQFMSSQETFEGAAQFFLGTQRG